jgi:hypothetical protein
MGAPMASAAPLARAPSPSFPAPGRGPRRLAPKPGAGDRVDLDPPDPETKLVTLSRAAAPLRQTLSRLAGRIEALRGWERIGWARRRDYAKERLGVSGRQLQELAHMDRAFARLEAVERAFVSGRITWTKARLLARVAAPEDAELWIAHAAAIPPRELSREVRAVDERARDLLRPETDEEGEGEGGSRGEQSRGRTDGTRIPEQVREPGSTAHLAPPGARRRPTPSSSMPGCAAPSAPSSSAMP